MGQNVAARLVYVEGKDFKKSSAVPTSKIGSKDTKDFLEEYKRYIDDMNGKFFYLAASGTDHVAEEGPILWDGQALKVPQDTDSTAPSQGYGYFTYTLLAHLKDQMASASKVRTSAPVTSTTSPALEPCEINLSLRFADTLQNFLKWGQLEKALDLQIPGEVNSFEKFPPLQCPSRTLK